MTSHESSHRSNNSSTSEVSLNSQSLPIAELEANDRQPTPKIQWGLVVLAGLIFYFLPQVQLSTVLSKIFSAASVDLYSSENPTSNEDTVLDGKTLIYVIKHHSHVDDTKRPNVSCDSERSLPTEIRVSSCR
jgi:hypothetical protein